VHEWVEVTAALVRDAKTRWLMRFDDHGCSLVDAVSFEIMRREKLTQVFAFDHHFGVAGFELFNP
jgi:predicted nucleic acid-binding protein